MSRLILLPSLFTDGGVFDRVREAGAALEAVDPLTQGPPLQEGDGLVSWGHRLASHLLAQGTLREGEAVRLGGFCLGGMLALAMADALRPTRVTVTELVLISSGPGLIDLTRRRVRLLRRAIEPLPRVRRLGVGAYTLPSLQPPPRWLRGPLGALAEAERRRRPSWVVAGGADLREVVTQRDRALMAELGFRTGDLDPKGLPPVRLLHGTRDPFLPVQRVERAVAAFDHATLERVEGAGHFLPTQHPSRVARFLNGT